MFRKSRKTSISVLALFMVMAFAFAIASTQSSYAQEGAGLTDTGGATFDSVYATDKEEMPAAAAARVDPATIRPVSYIVTFDDTVDAATVEALTGGTVVHRYSKVFNGVSIVMPEDNINNLVSLPGITGIYEDPLLQVDTENSPQFIGAPTLWNQLGGQEVAGEGVVFGSIDTGVWPEHPSFSDPDPMGNPYPAPPMSGLPCEFGNTAWNPNDAPFTCNNKLIGAYQFLDTYKAVVGLTPAEFDSARDDDGHGTHTSTTAAGNAGVQATIAGGDLGIVSGIAPRAYVIAYKACGAEGCFGSDTAAAVEQAILDGVDVINYSISGGGDPYNDATSIAFLNAYFNGVLVSASAGNSGPGADTVAHREPWTITVGASTQDRTFAGKLSLSDEGGATLELDGVSLTGDYTGQVVLASDYGDGLCLTPFPAGTFNGEIVVCERGLIARVEKGYNVLQGGAGGMVLYNPVLQSLAPDIHFLPAIHIQNDAGAALLDFLANATGAVTGTIDGGIKMASQGNVMAAFSSRGGAGQTLGVSKPDVTAPGVEVLAGHTPMPSSIAGGAPGNLFQVIQGTSMSSPHVAGSALLLKDLHPDWTPGQIKSALMTTAYVDGLVKEDGVTPVDNFDAGSGHIDLNRAGNPGLTISDSALNLYLAEDHLWDANLPSLYVPNMPGKITVERTVHSELRGNSWWRTRVEAPADLSVSVRPVIGVRGGGDRTFSITVDASLVPMGETRFATLYLERGPKVVRFPITIVRGEPNVAMTNTCASDVLVKRGETTTCEITVTNYNFTDTEVSVTDTLPRLIQLDDASLVGADLVRTRRSFAWSGVLAAAQPPLVNVAVDPLASPAGYLSLTNFGSSIAVSASDESITNFNVPAFEFAGETYSQIGIVSNGYIVVGGGTSADVNYINADMPNAAPPNNVLAPFWTDLNPSAGGNILINTLTDGVNSWIVVEWLDVPNWGDGRLNTFQVWISYTQPDDISFTYGPTISDGDSGFLTVGAENAFGNSGGTVYFDGVGTPPAPSFPNGNYEVDVFTTPGAAGGSHTITFDIQGWRPGDWTNCAEMTSPSFAGTSAACFSGSVVMP